MQFSALSLSLPLTYLENKCIGENLHHASHTYSLLHLHPRLGKLVQKSNGHLVLRKGEGETQRAQKLQTETLFFPR